MPARDKAAVSLGRLRIEASRWPWQGYGWRGTSAKITAPLAGGARFGGGWSWCLGIRVGGRSVLLDLLFGIVRVRFETRADKVERMVRERLRAKGYWPTLTQLSDATAKRPVEAWLRDTRCDYEAVAEAVAAAWEARYGRDCA